MQKELSSTSIVRFQDCDPYNHLNHASYLNYFMVAREDQVLEAYGLDIYNIAVTQGTGWVVAQNQIAYVRPAYPKEKVQITSKIIQCGPRKMTVEFQMRNDESKALKCVLWSQFAHVDIRKGKSIPHSEELMSMFEQVVVDISEKSFDDRTAALRNEQRVARNE